MALKTVTFTSCTKLPCAGCTVADVIICVNPDKLGQRACPESVQLVGSVNDSWEWKTIKGQVINAGIVGGYYKYLLQYDDEYLADGVTELSCSDILAVHCYNCGDKYSEDLAGQDVKLELQINMPATSNQLILTNQHGCQYSFAYGAFSLRGDTGVTSVVNPGETIDIAGGDSIATVGSNPDTVTVNLALSTDANNAAEFGTDGNLFVPPGANGSFNVTADVGTPQAIVSGDTLDIEGGNSIGTTISATDKVTVALELSTDPGNSATLGSDFNLFVPTGAGGSFTLTGDSGTPQTISSGDTLNVDGGIAIDTVAGATDKVTINVAVSSGAGNALYVDGNNDLRVEQIYALTGEVGSGAPGPNPPPPISFIYNNPSSVYPLELFAFYVGAFEYDYLYPGVGPYSPPILYRNIDGAGNLAVGYLTHMTSGTDIIRNTFTSPDSMVDTVVAGGSETHSVDFDIPVVPGLTYNASISSLRTIAVAAA